MDSPDDSTEEVITGWTPIIVTAVVSLLQGLVFYMFFSCTRKSNAKTYDSNPSDTDQRSKALDLYEPRQHTRSHRSPPPFQSHWSSAARKVQDDDLLRSVGLDSYMFLRLLRLGARLTGLGSLLSLVLLPIYATGKARGPATQQFNQLTLARVAQGFSDDENASMVDDGSNSTSDAIRQVVDSATEDPSDVWRMYVAVGVWYIFCAFVLIEFYREWKLFYKNRSDFLAKGDPDTPAVVRYAARVEQVQPQTSVSNRDVPVQTYFERLFPNQVREAVSCVPTAELEKLVDERQKIIEACEAAVASTHAKPDKPAPVVKVKGFGKVEAIPHYQSEIERLNKEVDSMRADVVANQASTDTENKSTTAFVTFTSLRAKQAAVQCELTGDPDSVRVFSAADPKYMIWKNVNVTLPRQKIMQFICAIFFLVGILFWAIPVSFVASIANLNSILKSFKLKEADPNAAWYGLVAGLLPVVFLAILMIILYMVITFAATSIIRFKSLAEVDSYCLYWHMLFQFANLWLILIGGSLFNQIDVIVEDYTAIFDTLAVALPAASTFFVNKVLVSSFGAFGLELSMLPVYGVTMIMNLIKPEAARTQRQLDEGKEPPSIEWGKQVPPVVFVFLVAFLYAPIVPLMEVFAFMYFYGMHLVYRHQCLHVYAQQSESGGDATWQQVFGFLVACLYMGQLIFVAYLGLKKAPIPAGLALVPPIVTFLFHKYLKRKLIEPLRTLALEKAANVDIQDGELPLDLDGDDEKLYIQPVLNSARDERETMPYRRGTEAKEGAV